MKLNWLRVDRLRNVVPGTELHFGQRNVLLGQNATGKTTLLELVAAAARFNFAFFENEELDVTVQAERGGWRLELRYQNRRSERHDQATHRLEPLPDRFEQAVELKLSTPRELNLRAERGLLHADSASKPLPLALPLSSSSSLLENFAITLIEDPKRKEEVSVLWNWASTEPLMRFDESLGYFERLTEFPAAMVFGASPRLALYGDLLPPDAKALFVERLNADPDCSTVRMSSKEIESLARVARSLGFTHCSMAADREEKSADRIRFGSPRFEFARPDGSVINHRLLSYGQKRLLAFLFYLEVNRHLVVADELVNGLHHRWIEECLEAIGDRQAFLTSQNPLLLDFLSFESAQEARSSFIQCRKQPAGQGEVLSWTNLSEKESEDFFVGYEAGIQQVSEILESRGLW